MPAESRRPAGAAAGTSTRLATFVLLLGGATVATLFAVRLVVAALGGGWSPFPYVTPAGHALSAWLLSAGMVLLAALIWMVLRHDAHVLWLPSAVGDGGALVRMADLERSVASAVVRCHPDVLRAEVALCARGAVLRGRVTVWARPLADIEVVGAAVEAAARRQLARLSGRELDRLLTRVRVVKVAKLVRYLP